MSNETDKYAHQTSERIMDDAKRMTKKSMWTIRGLGRKRGKKSLKQVGHLVGKGMVEGLKAIVKFLGVSFFGWILVGFIIIVVLGIAFEYYPTDGVYFAEGDTDNIMETESSEIYVTSDNKDVARYGARNVGQSKKGYSILNYDTKVKKNEQNKAIENYNKFHAMNSEKKNKYYYPLKGLDESVSDDEFFNQLVRKELIALDGEAGFISQPTLSDFRSNWQDTYHVDGKNFTWTQSIADIDKNINKGAKLLGFKKEIIGDLTHAKFDDSKKEADMSKEELATYLKEKELVDKLKDPWNRESYFRLPADLLASLNQLVYDFDLIYSKPFVQPVKFNHWEKDESLKSPTSDSKDKENAENKEPEKKSSKVIEEKSMFDGVPKTLGYDEVVENVKNEKGKTVNLNNDSGKSTKSTEKNKNESKKKVIFIDAGHGGRDPGAVGNGLKEAEQALDIANKLARELQSRGHEVKFSRTDNRFIPLGNRYGMANSSGADIFVSIHLNSSGDPNAKGVEVLYKEDKRKSGVLAKSVQDRMVASTGAKNRGIKLRNDLAVLNGSKMPAILVEGGFVSSPAESSLIKTSAYKDKIARSIADGIDSYLGNNVPIILDPTGSSNEGVSLGKIETGIPDMYYQIDHVGVGKKAEGNYGLGTAYVYRPSIQIKLKKGVEVKQTLKGSSSVDTKTEKVPKDKNVSNSKEVGVKNDLGQTQDIEITVKKSESADINWKEVTTKTTTHWYEPIAKATPIHEVEVDIVYVLDKAITFSGVYSFDYEVEQKEIDSKYNTSPGTSRVNKDGEEVLEVDHIEYKEIEYKEVPVNVKLVNSVDDMYIDEYIKNFETTMPEDVSRGFAIEDLVGAFKGDVAKLTTVGASEGGVQGGGADVAQVERWRPLAEEIGEKWGVDPNLLLTLIHIESTGNPHTGNVNYRGLVSIGDKNYQSYFKNDPDFSSFTPSNRQPHNSGSVESGGCNINDAEHQRVARFNIEYLARRVSAQLGLYTHYFANLDQRKDEIPVDVLQTAILFGGLAYQTGEYGQLVTYDYYKDDEKLYSKPGTYWTSIFVKHLTGPGIPNIRFLKEASTMKRYNTTGESNKVYLERMYSFYEMHSGGVSLDESVAANFDKYDPTKWYVHSMIAGKTPGAGGGGASSAISGKGMNAEAVDRYLMFENEGLYKKGEMTTYAAGSKEVNADMVLKYAQAYIDNVSLFDIKDGGTGYSYWSDGYAENYFVKGKPVMPVPGEEMSEQIYTGEILQKEYTGSVDQLYDTAAMFGKQVYDVVKGGVEQVRKPYIKGASGPGAYDSAGLVWYTLGVKGKVKMELGTLEEFFEEFNREVGKGELKPGDIVFYKDIAKSEMKPIDMALYLGNDTILAVNKEKGVHTAKFSTYAGSRGELEYLSGRRVLRHGEGEAQKAGNMSGSVGQLPADLLKGEWVHPLGDYKVKVSSRFGWRIHPLKGGRSFHKGEDWPAPTGTPIYAPRAGIVQDARRSSSYGNMVILKHDSGYTTLYGHMTKYVVSNGQSVAKGQLIGYVGSTGDSSGPHLHWEIAKDYPQHIGGTKAEYPAGPYIDPKKVLGI